MYLPTETVPGSWQTRQWIPSGWLGIEATVWRMRRLARRGARDPLLRWLAASIVRQDADAGARAQAVRDFLERAVDFTQDPDGVELLKSVRYQLRELELHGRVAGDCDDVAVLGAALGMALGLPARFVLLAFTPGAPYEHVYAELLTRSGWVELDTTKPDQLPSGLEVVRHSTREA